MKRSFFSLLRKKAGFSLVEVNLALLVAAGGMLAVFGVFPGALRQSVMSASDMAQVSFATSLLEAIDANVRGIDDLSTWNDFDAWWSIAVSGTGLSGLDAKTAKEFGSDSLSEISKQPARTLARDADTETNGYIFYIGMEYTGKAWTTKKKSGFADNELVTPAQFLIRVSVREREAFIKTGVNSKDSAGAYLPNRYTVSIISTDQAKPIIYHNSEQRFVQEYCYLHRP